MNRWTESPLKLVEMDSVIPEKKNMDRKLHMAGNSYESYQILIEDEDNFEIIKVELTGMSEFDFRYNFQESVSFKKETFQDPLSNNATATVKSGQIQSIWITLYADENIVSGVYQGIVKVTTKKQAEQQDEHLFPLEIKVYPVVIPVTEKGAFVTEYWMNTVNFWFRYPNREQLDFINYHYGCEKYSETWWKINKAIAKHMKENRINVLFVRTLDLLLDGGTILDKQGKYHFNWELFDKWINFFKEHGAVKLFAGYHLVVQTKGKNIYLIKNGENGPEIAIAPIGSQEADSWMEQFLTALYEHLEEKGYKNSWLQHVEDEPGEPESWKYARQWVRKCMPGIPTMDAIDKQNPIASLQEEMDIWIPRVDVYEENRDFYDYRMSQGDSRWIYNCCEPHYQNYVNKFLGWPLIHNRALAWGCFVNHFSGFLHWGYNFWDPSDQLFGLNPDALIKGDGYIVYPDKENDSIKNSVRMIATRDGAQDFELLKLLADKNPEKAFKLARKVIHRFNDFNWEHENMEEQRIQILESIELDEVGSVIGKE